MTTTTETTASSNVTRTYLHGRREWPQQYPDRETWDDVLLMVSDEQGALIGEAKVTWRVLGPALTARLEVFDDAWRLLPHIADVLSALAERRPDVNVPAITPEELCALLESLGFARWTKA